MHTRKTYTDNLNIAIFTIHIPVLFNSLCHMASSGAGLQTARTGMPSVFFLNMNKPEHPRSPDGKNEWLRGERSQPMFHLNRAIYAQLDYHRYWFEAMSWDRLPLISLVGRPLQTRWVHGWQTWERPLEMDVGCEIRERPLDMEVSCG